ncbi:helix-turn-helix transcriptional regulator [Microbacterium sp.]|uniref:helix-turn-helix transcriptional regulator n=1 Tax=Microbacterium sp. TaxID=51671 RepID=UPI003C7966B0
MEQFDSAESFGELIRENRRRLGITQEDLARAVGKSRRWIIELEAGQEGVGLGAALAAARAVGLRLNARSIPDDGRDLLALVLGESDG